MQFLCVETDVPVLLFEDNGSLVYSPVNKRKDQCNAMEGRVTEMLGKRENLSPTGKKLKLTYKWLASLPMNFWCTCLAAAFRISYLTWWRVLPFSKFRVGVNALTFSFFLLKDTRSLGRQ